MPETPAAVGPETLERFVEDLCAGRREACLATARGLLDRGLPLVSLYQDLVQAALYEVGARWEAGRVSVATEHVATAVAEEVLGLAFVRALQSPRNGKRAVVSCAADEFHQVGGRIVADVLECWGWRVGFVGAGARADDVLARVREDRPDLVAISVTIPAHLPAALEVVAKVRALRPDVPILVGGQAFRSAPFDDFARVPGVQQVATLAALEAAVAG